MRKMIAAGCTALFLATGAGAAVAGHEGDEGHLPQDKGLCTAYFNGSEKGQENKRKAGPFAALELRASDGASATTPEEDVRAFCAGLIGGRPGAGDADSTAPGGGKP